MLKSITFAKMAAALGRQYATEKHAGLLDTAISAAGKHVNWWAPAVAGAVLAGPGYRTEGALAGGLAGRLGLRAGRMAGAKSLKGADKFFKGKGLAEHAEAAKQIGRGEAVQGLVKSKGIPDAQRVLNQWGTGGALAGGAGVGYGAGRLLGAQNPYGMQPVFPGLGKENPMGIRPQ